jgi:hypothetical protein
VPTAEAAMQRGNTAFNAGKYPAAEAAYSEVRYGRAELDCFSSCSYWGCVSSPL